MRAAFVMTTIMLALALGIAGATSEGRLVMRALIIGFFPAIWSLSHVLERLTSRDMWRFTAPYPYRWIGERRETARPRPNPVRKPVQDGQTMDNRSSLPVAA